MGRMCILKCSLLIIIIFVCTIIMAYIVKRVHYIGHDKLMICFMLNLL